jgi:hypothetical protein
MSNEMSQSRQDERIKTDIPRRVDSSQVKSSHSKKV